MRFKHRIQSIPCIIHVTDYQKPLPMRITGTGFGDADPPEDEVFEYEVLDRKGRRAPWLELKVTDSDDAEIYQQFLEHKNEV